MSDLFAPAHLDRSKILTEKKGDTFVITLNRPEKRNALDGNLMFGIKTAIEDVFTSTSIRAIIIRGEGAGFSAGVDFLALAGTGLMTEGGVHVRRLIREMQDIVNLIDDIEKPVIFAVHGFCFGMATELILSGDFRIAQRGTKFGIQETAVGLIPDVGGTTRMTRLLGPIKAKELIMTAKTIDADEAKTIQLVNDVVDDAFAGALEFADTLNKNAPLAVGLAKKLINRAQHMDARSFMELEAIAQSTLIHTEDVKEGIAAKIEKREPKFTGK